MLDSLAQPTICESLQGVPPTSSVINMLTQLVFITKILRQVSNMTEETRRVCIQ